MAWKLRLNQVLPPLALVAALGGAAHAGATYLYIPNVLVVQTGDDADTFLSEMEVTLGVQPSDDPIWADRPDLKRLDRTARVMERHWERLDEVCDPNAVFALMYLTTTYGVRFHIHQNYFADNDYLSIITVAFANLYLNAYDHWLKGERDRVPLAWQEAFDYAITGESTITEDEFLGMNAHINYDLAVAIHSLGITSADGQSRKPDMDRINHVLADVTDDVGYLIALHYGPTPPTQEPNWGEGNNVTPETQAVLEGIYLWREHAWNNAVVMDTLTDPTSREAHDASMQSASYGVAQGFHSPKLSPTAPDRLAYCQTHP